jgi:hypothetical protein
MPVTLNVYYFLLNKFRWLRQKALRIFLYKKTSNIIKSRKKLEITDIDNISADISQNKFFAYTPEKYTQNDYYGIATNLKKYSGLPYSRSLDYAIEHGIDFYSDGSSYDIHSTARGILTFSKYREERLKKATPKEIHCIGPYIHYAPHYLSNKNLEREKKRLGKNFLVFPAHSTPGVDSEFDIDKFCTYLKKISRGFDSVRVCLYWKDILMGRDKPYKKHGFECVTAGHIYDPMFLSRLKSIIEVSAMTATNGVGTHIGYCILMGKPVYYFKQEVKLNKDLFFQNDDTDPVTNAFSKFSQKINSKQIQIIDYYWGLKCVKTPKELKKILFND